MWKAQQWGGIYERYETINLNKKQRSNERVSQDKEFLERHNDSLQNKKVRKFVAFLTGVLGCLNVNRAAKKHAGWQNLSKDINKFWKKGPQIRCIPHGRWGLAQCKSTCEEHAGSDISFENITLCLDQLPLKIQFTKEKRTLKTLVLSREANTLPQYKSSCKEQASSDKNLSVKPYSLISCCFKHNL